MRIIKLVEKYSERWLRVNRVYIMPTEIGFYFGALIFIIFLISLTYGNNTLMLLAFLLLSQFILFMIMAHLNLKRFNLKKLTIVNGHQRMTLKGHFSSEVNKVIFDINIICPSINSDAINFEKITTDRKLYQLNGHYPKRGLIKIDKIQARSSYPLGLFKTWKVIQVDLHFYSLPELVGEGLDAYFNLVNDGNDLFKEHIQYNTSASYQKINWKHYAKSDHLVLKDFEAEVDQELHFNFSTYEDQAKKEKMISQYALWIYEAHSRGFKWQFTDQLKPDQNLTDLQQVMEYLACC